MCGGNVRATGRELRMGRSENMDGTTVISVCILERWRTPCTQRREKESMPQPHFIQTYPNDMMTIHYI